MGVFQMASPGVAGAGEDEGEGDGGPRYPEPPARAYRLPELLRLAGLEEQAGDAPDLEVSGILTCNSVSPAEGALYVCVPSADGQHDGHDWADEVRGHAEPRMTGGWTGPCSRVPASAASLKAGRRGDGAGPDTVHSWDGITTAFMFHSVVGVLQLRFATVPRCNDLPASANRSRRQRSWARWLCLRNGRCPTLCCR